MNDNLRFVAVEFTEDPLVAGNTYWYLCEDFAAEAGDFAVAPLGRHNRLQTGTVRKVGYFSPAAAPYPLERVKSVVKIIKRI